MATSKLRYWAPQLATLAAMLCGFLSIVAATQLRFVEASWLILLSTFLDRADGLLARSLHATSEFGVQMDSFADFFDFGVAPAVLLFIALTETPGLPFASGQGYALALGACAFWIGAATFRLARFNVLTDVAPDKSLFNGIPTTLAAGLLVNWFLVCLKYAAPGNPLGAAAQFSEARLFGPLQLGPGAWSVFPIAMLIGGVLMVSNLRCKKFVLFKSKLGSATVVLLTLGAFVCLLLRVFPEFMVLLPSTWIAFWLVYGQLAPRYRALPSPPLFPVGDDE
ncbi:CDP-alcohol phosphatidyltransferase family protein [Nannocystis sp.]|uniref:CDP-alcohol phosphatidyltransferase family protein n=1 Tax=Nannocystis sp. TaxID=1962667 RepID=UPI002425C1DA|nr:CDP-alcohol phosphatidyltransferase family protein [Nannocystis sp.]MBK7825228.1 CDP-alcohol phosphatidyltransferase family protein [Nannocystis sp.]MBK9756909.1 CDP-alcohol phosphatidyltransferase family protein [Nannocystis sp.]